MNDARIEYCEYFYNRMKDKLLEAKEYELATFTVCGMLLKLRASDIIKLKWEQFDFKNNIVHNVKQTKLSIVKRKDVFIDIPMIMDNNLKSDLKEIYDLWRKHSKDKEHMFSGIHKYDIGNKIIELTGIFNYTNHMLRQVGITLQLKELEVNK